MLLHLVDATGEDAGKAYEIIRAELDAYGHGLEDKTEIVALSKIDAVTPEILKEQKAKLKRAAKKEPLLVSAASNKGVTEILRALATIIDDNRKQDAEVGAEEKAWHP